MATVVAMFKNLLELDGLPFGFREAHLRSLSKNKKLGLTGN